ncbi:5-histidylcysteine sulfoxide synthase [Cerasicoccus arenae]|uniref:SAM-dependent methyltransferase n=1 Tax=Cerasicoccus arenae TaxID=424488 RepID=A0A8J3DGM3_9BACT|nr:5-histidylcysteine sulfoxide synthase [Cerasicoccus arenae]MBK1856763.1 5-histidylcysteine sulfoxide synthase [Cerasicoccus arenae]GHB99339.1 SAM-dependent methyltransferase [Cerasicoccus arenae]
MPTAHESFLDGVETPLTVNLREGDPNAKREEIRRYFHQTFDIYEKLFEPMKGQEAFVARADPLRHPLIFYYGHTAVFFVNKLILGKFLKNRLDPHLESLCAIGVDEMSWDDLNGAHYQWPDHNVIKTYRDRVRNAIDRLIDETPLELPVQWNSLYWIIMMGIEHERIHLETSSVLIRQLPLELVEPEHPAWAVCENDAPPPSNELLTVPPGTVVQGKKQPSEFYGWDNEYGHYEAEVGEFKAAKYLVSNAEFRTFVDDGGYTKEQFWTEEGWSWAQYDAHGMPRFWRLRKDGSYGLRTMLKEIDMPWSWPAEVNYLEAKAYCNWLGSKTNSSIRLPSEEEWYRLLDFTGAPDVNGWQDGAPGNINLEVCASATPVNRYAFGQGFYDILGNVWQHTETPIAGFSGFGVHPLYDDFSTPTFDTKHNLIKGGSWISTGNETLRDSRYAFRRHFYQHAGFRYIESELDVAIKDDRYETDPFVTLHCEAHYGPEAFGVENYSEKIAQICLDRMTKSQRGKALDIGCKVGRTSFELAAGFNQVLGLDPTARTIRIGVEMIDKGYTQWEAPSEGEIVNFRQAYLKDIGLDRSRSKVEFMQADLSNMKDLYRGYDLILINCILEHSYHPAKFLETVHERLNDDGLLVIASTNDWSTEHTQREDWLGGFKDRTGENQSTIDGIQLALSEKFVQAEPAVDIPQIIRHNSRSYEHNLVQVSFWRKA